MPKRTPTSTPTPTLNVPDAARYIGFSVWWLKVQRRRRRGPAFLRIGRTIRYRVSDLDAWLESNVVRTKESRAS